VASSSEDDTCFHSGWTTDFECEYWSDETLDSASDFSEEFCCCCECSFCSDEKFDWSSEDDDDSHSDAHCPACYTPRFSITDLDADADPWVSYWWSKLLNHLSDDYEDTRETIGGDGIDIPDDSGFEQ
jgi:hypothetical protein